MLVILDACRVDAMKQVADEYSFVESVDEHYSVGSKSNEWIANTFVEKYEDEINDTTYVTSNLFAKRVLEQREFPPKNQPFVPFCAPKWRTVDGSAFHHIDPVWEYVEHSGSGGFPARPVTDRTIELCRERTPERVVVHYMQPHQPFMTVDEDVHERWRNGDVDRTTVWEAYVDNLRYVLDEVEILVNNTDAGTVVITADHGEAFDEWGFKGHTLANPISAVRKVPWIETTATDTGSHVPKSRERESLEEDDIQRRLEDLGYM